MRRSADPLPRNPFRRLGRPPPRFALAVRHRHACLVAQGLHRVVPHPAASGVGRPAAAPRQRMGAVGPLEPRPLGLLPARLALGRRRQPVGEGAGRGPRLGLAKHGRQPRPRRLQPGAPVDPPPALATARPRLPVEGERESASHPSRRHGDRGTPPDTSPGRADRGSLFGATAGEGDGGAAWGRVARGAVGGGLGARRPAGDAGGEGGGREGPPGAGRRSGRGAAREGRAPRLRAGARGPHAGAAVAARAVAGGDRAPRARAAVVGAPRTGGALAMRCPTPPPCGTSARR